MILSSGTQTSRSKRLPKKEVEVKTNSEVYSNNDDICVVNKH